MTASDELTADASLVVRPSRLHGTVAVDGAKNSGLRLVLASILTDEELVLDNAPVGIGDFGVQLQMLESLGIDTAVEGSRVSAKGGGLWSTSVDDWSERSIRNTLLMLGALVGRHGRGRVPLPGGCDLGDRRFDLHELVLRSLGADVRVKDGFLEATSAGRLRGADIALPIRSTGATENTLLAAVLAEGTTVLRNPHVRPEILDLVALLRSMGAQIETFGQERFEITGVPHLRGTRHAVMSDPMEAITWVVAAAITGGEVAIQNFPFDALEVPLIHLAASGVVIRRSGPDLLIVGPGSICTPIEIATGPHPGINSDVQPLFAAFAGAARGRSVITDLRFPGRYQYQKELAALGIRSEVRDGALIIDGQGAEALRGNRVRALDLRAGAALALAGLMAEGETVVSDAWQIGRGYSHFPTKLRALGADVLVV